MQPKLAKYRRRKAIWRFYRPKRRSLKLAILKFANSLIPRESQRVFILTLIVGAVCGLAAVGFHLAILAAESLLIENALESRYTYALGLLTPVIGGAICGWILTFAFPEARGSGIPQVKVAYALKGGGLKLRDAVSKFAVAVLQIGSGASLGREGPTVHICAAIASTLGRAFALSQRNLKRMLPVGAAAGIAAAFNAPISAVTFTIEEVVGDLDQTVLSGVIVAAAIAAAIERSILGEHPVLNVTQPFGFHHVSSLLVYAGLGMAAAGVSIIFSESLLRLRKAFRSFKAIPAWLHPSIGGLVTGILILGVLYFADSGGINGGGYDALNTALAGGLGLKLLLILGAAKLVATVFSYSSGGAGGIFAPSLFVGGMLGGVFGLIDVNLLGHSQTELGAFALVGMGAVFAGVIRAPITSVLIIFEMTGSYGLILPLMIANMTSYALASRFRPTPIYEALLEQDNIFLPHKDQRDKPLLHTLKVEDAMNREMVTLSADLTISRAFDQIQQYEFTVFPVIRTGDYYGLVSEMKLRRAVAADRGDHLVREIAEQVGTVFPQDTLAKAVLRMDRSKYRQLAVIASTEDRKLRGIVTMSDIARVQAKAVDDLDYSITPDRTSIQG